MSSRHVERGTQRAWAREERGAGQGWCRGFDGAFDLELTVVTMQLMTRVAPTAMRKLRVKRISTRNASAVDAPTDVHAVLLACAMVE